GISAIPAVLLVLVILPRLIARRSGLRRRGLTILRSWRRNRCGRRYLGSSGRVELLNRRLRARYFDPRLLFPRFSRFWPIIGRNGLLSLNRSRRLHPFSFGLL